MSLGPEATRIEVHAGRPSPARGEGTGARVGPRTVCPTRTKQSCSHVKSQCEGHKEHDT